MTVNQLAPSPEPRRRHAPMRTIVAAGALTLVATWWTASARSGTPPQAPSSGLPPVDYSLGPDSQPQPGVPKGKVTQHRLAPGKFFPGTPHDYQIYVPAQYDPARPIAWMIFLDGKGYAGDNVRVPVLLANLIARRELPRMMAFFLNPGVMPSLPNQAQSRKGRSF